ncbi:hypothetical protein [Spirilliplanes yamanashiensis]|uniref:Uncharacterized protein n=1 Tax=Spirilliplanes yamanashiensis TaxID=42233 RepID=A0A8J3YEM8_9ACTN|nr:hypothetical protein [Spirilliplanes yamanashiensis]MDP9816765.1 hypothetical protein [Spirilliplanes yamanashiensis]GIJ06287.1 hypothetical protein Sya03_56390 [Spirilliplanes yamanashiensis]
MGRFLAIFHGAADEAGRAGLSDEQQGEFMRVWAAWAQAHERALADPGAPLFRKKRVECPPPPAG